MRRIGPETLASLLDNPPLTGPCERAMERGLFITFVGGEGAGKSTQVARLTARMVEQGVNVVSTREPGGSPGAEAIRALLVRGAADRWSSTTEALLMYAARRDHIERLIRPALDAGTTVICDRFADSTRAYQGAAGGAPGVLIDVLEQTVLGEIRPALTLILDLPAASGLARAARRSGGESRFEQKELDFHERLRAAFLEIARDQPDRCVVIDATASKDAVAEAIWAEVAKAAAPR